jgi:hypothetical protein
MSLHTNYPHKAWELTQKFGIELIEPTNKNLGSKPATNELATAIPSTQEWSHRADFAIIRFPASNGKFHV